MEEMDAMLRQFGVHASFQFVFIFALLVWTRMLALVSMVPFPWGKPVPMLVRVSGATVMMVFVVPLLLPSEPPPITNNMLLVGTLFLKEAILGVVIGFAASLVFYGFEAAGHMIENQRGMSIAHVLIPQLGTQGSLASQLLFLLSITIYFVMQGHVIFLETFYHSFVTFPVLEFPAIAPGWFPLVDFLAKSSGAILTMAIGVAAPVIIAILLADIILGVANRVAPQINVWELGFNIKGYLGVLILALMMVLMTEVFTETFRAQRAVDTTTQQLLERRIPVEGLPGAPGILRPVPWLPAPLL
ncbi:MAG: flagellar biosynthetic protein FliR [Deltaproteobacteria bacterium]|nr:flagellar biosynthetic protein FliR [Deltaproteobacteria bacterium]